MAWFKKKDVNLEEYRDITDDVLESEFVPYACHRDASTILTKNGELLQIIKIVGFVHESVLADALDLRDAVRKAILDNIPSKQYGLWFHTIRSRKDLSLHAHFKDPFTAYLNEQWNTRHHWHDGFTNELYISIVHEGQSAELRYPGNFMRGLVPGADRKWRERFLEETGAALEAVVSGMLKTLEAYGARRLGVVERDGIYYSEPCEFLGKVINLTEDTMPLPDIDLSHYLTTQEITFGFNAMEVRSHQDKRRFGAVLTLKDYKEIPALALDSFLQLPIEFIVSQCMDFIGGTKALADYKEQKKVSDMSEDTRLAMLSGLDDIMDSNKGGLIDYGSQQLSVFILADTLKLLEKNIATAMQALHQLGIIAVREDIKFEECYWAQLPANFEFVKRLKSINTRRIGGFANLSNFPAGKATGNPWGQAVALFRTAARTPYYFNFHGTGNSHGHTSIIGPLGSGKTVLVNFLLAQSQKFSPRLFYFDRERGAEIFLRTLQGRYWRPTLSAATHDHNVTLNPFRMEDNDKNRRFLFAWVMALLDETSDTLHPDAANALQTALQQLFALPGEQRSLSGFIGLATGLHPALAEPFSPWHGAGVWAHLFDHAEESLPLSANVFGVNMSDVAEEDVPLAAIGAYLLHRVSQTLDNTPAIIVLDEAWELLDNPLYGPRVGGWLDMAGGRGAMVILATEDVETAVQSTLTPALMEKAVTQIYLPNDEAEEAYESVFHLSKQERRYVENMRPEKRHFLLKRGGEAIVAGLDLGGMKDVLAVLSATPEGLATLDDLAPGQDVWQAFKEGGAT